MKIDKDFAGLKRIENGDYVLEGNLISDDCIEVDLYNRFVVKGKIVAQTYIKAVWGIEAGWGIEAETYIDCKNRIFAGLSVYHTSDNCIKTIQCAELRNGEIGYGDLIITGNGNTEK